MINPVHAATQHLAKQGATFEGHSSIFKRRQDLNSDQVIERAQKGRPVEVRIGEQMFSVQDPSDLLELDFFQARGKGEGLPNLSLARTLRDVKLDLLEVSNPDADCVPMEAYQILTGQEKGTVYCRATALGVPEAVGRDDVQALGLFLGNVGQASELDHPERAESLMHLRDAKMLSRFDRPEDVYIKESKMIALGDTRFGFSFYLPKERLEQPENIEQTLKNLAQVEELRQQYLPAGDNLQAGIHQLAWAGKLDIKQCQPLFESFAEVPEGEKKLQDLLRLVPAGTLPNSQQVSQYHALRSSNLAESSIRPEEFQWLTADSTKFEERLQLLNESRKLRSHNPKWENSGLSETLRLDGNPKSLELLNQLGNIHPLTPESYALACSLEPKDYQRFEKVYQQFYSLASEHESSESDKALDLERLWSDAGPSFEKNHEKLLEKGLDPSRALMASAALGDHPTPAMLELAAQLQRERPGYRENDYAVALKCAARMDPQEQKIFQGVFCGKDLSNWSQTWRNLHSDGKIDPALLEVHELLQEAGASPWELSDMRSSGVSGETLLKNLKETPEEKSLRGQRWLAYTARGLSDSNARSAARALSHHIGIEKNVQELRELDHWYISGAEYMDKEAEQARSARRLAAREQEERAQATNWDSRMESLQNGSIPWGEPPSQV